MAGRVLISTDFKDLKLFRKGKVRDVYDLNDKLLIVSTDRISSFDVVLPCGIPNKGKVLTSISQFWFDFTKDIIPNHFITADVEQYPEELKKYKEVLMGRSMLVVKSKPLPVESIVRGYISGSGWKEYIAKGSLCGVEFSKGLKESDKLPEVIFTPSTKADTGHDQNVSQEFIEGIIGKERVGVISKASIEIYKKASEYALRKGIIIADTKFEFGLKDDRVILIDEALTPDSSRFWLLSGYSPGKPQASLDKQFVRDYLESLNWDKTPPAPALTEEVIAKTSEKYIEVHRILTGKDLS